MQDTGCNDLMNKYFQFLALNHFRALDQHTLHYTSTVDTAAAAITNRTHLTSQQTEQSQNAQILKGSNMYTISGKANSDCMQQYIVL